MDSSNRTGNPLFVPGSGHFREPINRNEATNRAYLPNTVLVTNAKGKQIINTLPVIHEEPLREVIKKDAKHDPLRKASDDLAEKGIEVISTPQLTAKPMPQVYTKPVPTYPTATTQPLREEIRKDAKDDPVRKASGALNNVGVALISTPQLTNKPTPSVYTNPANTPALKPSRFNKY